MKYSINTFEIFNEIPDEYLRKKDLRNWWIFLLLLFKNFSRN